MVNRRKRWRRGRRGPLELLEEAYVKHVVQACSVRQVETDGDVVDQLGDAVRPEVAGLELARRCLRKRGSGTLTQAKEGPIAHLIGHLAMSRVVVAFLDLLCLFQPRANVGEELLALRHAPGNSSDPRVSRLV